MAELALPREGLRLPTREQAQEWALAHADLLALFAVMGLAAVLRFWGLGYRALHHDESLHATYSWYYYQGRGYQHDPLMHGPFQFNIDALFFFFFGATDFSARIPHAVIGTALVGMPYFLRKQIGMKAVLIAAVLLTFSPTILYFSRFDREDIYTAFWTFAVVICIWRYLYEQKSLYLYLLAGALALSFATKETTFILAAIVMLFLDMMLAIELGKRRPGEDASVGRDILRSALLVPFAWLAAAIWPLLGTRPFGRDRLPPVGDVLIIFGTMSLPQFAAGIQKATFVENLPLLKHMQIAHDFANKVRDKGYNVSAENGLRISTVLVLLIMTLYVGLLWKPKQWLIAAAFFYVPYVLLFTTFFTHMSGFWTGIWGSLDYWLAQQGVKRGNQPMYYYALITPLYEFLPLLLALGGSFWLLIKGNAFKRWLLFWALAIFVGLSLAGEKMPWLGVHIALPLVIAGAVALATAIDLLGITGRRWLILGALAVTTAIAVLLLVGRSVPLEAKLFGGLLLGGLIAWLVLTPVFEGARRAGQVALTIAVAALFTLTVRAGIEAAYVASDVPTEMLIYTQTSHDIVNLRDRIDALAKESGLGLNLPIVVDSNDGFSWPWAWYLRDYHNVQFTAPTAQGFKTPEGAVLLIDKSDVGLIDPTGFTQTPYKHRWWFSETYRDLTVGKVEKIVTSPSELSSLWSFFLHRRSSAEPNTGSADAVAFFPESLSNYDVAKAPEKPAAAPQVLPDGRIVIGRQGSGPGELAQPSGMFVDASGNVWIADTLNNRVQEFDKNGNYVATLGRPGNGPGQMNQPWSVAVDSQGFVYVADTWNHRIEKFSPSLQFVTAWGLPFTNQNQNPGPLDLFGPRAIAVAPDGTIWITDTGDKRLVHYSNSGDVLGTFGNPGKAPGEFNEPVGLTFDSAGNMYVADTWNARIQKFGPGPSPSGQISAGWTSQGTTDKPYVAVLTDGRIVASEPAKGELLLFASDGTPLGVWKPDNNSQPLGVAPLADGGFVFSDGRLSTVQIVPGGLIAALFH